MPMTPGLLLGHIKTNMKKLLVPFDFSPQAVEALKFAGILAGKQKAELKILHVIELPVLLESTMSGAFEQKYMQEQRTTLVEKIDRIADRWTRGISRASTGVEFGSIIPVIENVIKSYGADMIVMGTHGASGIQEFTIGTNTEKIVRRSTVPVVSVRNQVNDVANLVVPTQGNTDVEKLMEHVKELQSLFRAKIHLLFVNTPAAFRKHSEVKPQLDAIAKKYRLKEFTANIYNDSSEADGIINFAVDIPDAMVVMRTHGRKGITHLAVGSVAEDVVNHIECPIWTLRIK